MNTTQRAARYLAAYRGGQEIPGGLSYPAALAKIQLDGSMESLRRIDYLLDQIREKQQPLLPAFLQKQANQTFLYLLAFYAGDTVGAQAKAPVAWHEWDEMAAQDAGFAAAWPRSFESSVACTLALPGATPRRWLPLVAIAGRMAGTPGAPSVHASASGLT